MTQTNKAGLGIVARNPEVEWEKQYFSVWLLCARDREDLRIFVSRDGATRPRIVRKEAA